MIKKLLFLCLMMCAYFINAQQMKVAITGSTVKFTTRVDGSLGNDWGSAPVYLYAYCEATDNSENLLKNF